MFMASEGAGEPSPGVRSDRSRSYRHRTPPGCFSVFLLRLLISTLKRRVENAPASAQLRYPATQDWDITHPSNG